MKLLNETKVGQNVKLGEDVLRVSLTSKGCYGCFFDNNQGAKHCQYKTYCFAHTRKDRRSVRFIKIQ